MFYNERREFQRSNHRVSAPKAGTKREILYNERREFQKQPQSSAPKGAKQKGRFFITNAESFKEKQPLLSFVATLGGQRRGGYGKEEKKTFQLHCKMNIRK